MGRPPLAALVWLLASGCDRLFELSPVPDAIGPPDAEFSFCYGNQLARTCLRDEPTVALQEIVGLIDTDDAAMCTEGRAGGQPVCVIAGLDLVVNALSVSGSRPLVLLATAGMEVDSTVNVASTMAKSGPAAPATCGANDGVSAPEAGGGGAGGSFVYAGGPGGGGAGTAAGRPALSAFEPLLLAGGCPGGAGGARAGGPSAGGGRGGGAIAFVAGTTIVVTSDAIINASGAAGRGGAVGAGGGGGGAGGMILFDAPTVELAGNVFARGSGGGGGGGTTGAGVDGGEPINAMDQPPGSSGGAGGGANGGAPSGPDDGRQGGFPLPSVASAGGGGGGGSGGYIVVYGDLVLVGEATNPVAIEM